MIEWKVGKIFQPGYLLKMMCEEDSKEILGGLEEKMYKFVLFKKGNAVFTINGKHLMITSPSIFCLSDADDIRCTDAPDKYEMDVIYFHPSVINHLFDCENVVTGEFDADWTSSANQDRYLLFPFFERKSPTSGCFKIELNAFNKMVVLFNKLQEQMALESDGFWPCRSRSYFIEILIMIQMKYLDDSDGQEFLELSDAQQELSAILDYMHSNYNHKITIELLTKKFGLNRNALNKQFNLITGYTPISYLIRHRLKVAESLLINTQVPVHEICERVGFSELSNFMRTFKKQYGDTPANYRVTYSTM